MGGEEGAMEEQCKALDLGQFRFSQARIDDDLKNVLELPEFQIRLRQYETELLGRKIRVTVLLLLFMTEIPYRPNRFFDAATNVQGGMADPVSFNLIFRLSIHIWDEHYFVDNMNLVFNKSCKYRLCIKKNNQLEVKIRLIILFIKKKEISLYRKTILHGNSI